MDLFYIFSVSSDTENTEPPRDAEYGEQTPMMMCVIS